MPTEMQTVTTTSDYHVAASDWLRFTNQGAFVLNQFGGPAPHLWISGEVDVARTQATDTLGVAGIQINNTYDHGPSVSLDVGATLNVTVSIPGGPCAAARAMTTWSAELAQTGSPATWDTTPSPAAPGPTPSMSRPTTP